VLRATRDGRALLHDGLRLRDGDAHVALAPGHRVVTTVSLLGLRAHADDVTGGVLTLEGPGALARLSGASAAGVDAAAGELWQRWARRVAAHASAPAALA
jgi:hypothetical protein